MPTVLAILYSPGRLEYCLPSIGGRNTVLLSKHTIILQSAHIRVGFYFRSALIVLINFLGRLILQVGLYCRPASIVLMNFW